VTAKLQCYYQYCTVPGKSSPSTVYSPFSFLSIINLDSNSLSSSISQILLSHFQKGEGVDTPTTLMYGLDLSADIQTSVKRTPRKYANLRGTTDRFAYANKLSDTAALPFYDTGRYTSIAKSVTNSPRKLSHLRSKDERFPKHGFMQKYFDKSRLITQNKFYDTDVLKGASMVTQCLNSPRTYGLKSQSKRFHSNDIDTPYGPLGSKGYLGPGSYQAAEEVSTSSGRYLSTVGSILVSPRHYSSFKSKSPRFKGGGFRRAAGGGSMWPPMKSRR
jgi:hypothetical protein